MPRSSKSTSAMKAAAPSDYEARAIGLAVEQVSQRRPRVAVKIASDGSGSIKQLEPPHSDGAGFVARLEAAFGTRGQSFPASCLNQLASASRLKDGTIDQAKLNGLLAVVDGVEPTNEVEAMLAVQLAIAHGFAVELLLRAQRVDQIPQLDCAGNMAAKMLRVFATHAELLHKMKRGGEQVVKVVHVHPGAQAVVGNVTTGGRGGEENGHQPHASHSEPGEPRSLVHAPGATMPCPDQSRQPVPVAGRQR